MYITTLPKCPVVVIRDALHQVKHGSWQAAYGTVPVVPYPHVQVSCVKVLKVLIKWYEILRKKTSSRRQNRAGILDNFCVFSKHTLQVKSEHEWWMMIEGLLLLRWIKQSLGSYFLIHAFYTQLWIKAHDFLKFYDHMHFNVQGSKSCSL